MTDRKPPVPQQPDGSSSCMVLCRKCGSNQIGIQTFRPANYLPDGKGGRTPTVHQDALSTADADEVLIQNPLAYCANCLGKAELVTADDLPSYMKD